MFGQRKFGGNAQSIVRGRWLHHTSFLWDFSAERMRLLRHPPRAPAYRAGRPHGEFVCALREIFPFRSHLPERLPAALAAAGFDVRAATLAEAEGAVRAGTLCGTSVVSGVVAGEGDGGPGQHR